MGQSNSKSQRPTPQNAEASTSANTMAEFGANDLHDEASSSITPSPRSQDGSRRPSLRKRVVSLMKPGSGRDRTLSSSSASGSLGSVAGEREKRKSSWRKSRRWSKSPVVDFKPNQPTVIEDAERPSSPEIGSSRQQSTPSIPTNDKGKSREDQEREVEAPEENLFDVMPRVYTPSERTLTPYPSMSEMASTQRRESPSRLSEAPARVAEPQPSGSQQPPTTPEPARDETPPAPTPSPTSTSPAGRQFPPPGTLVVVQGIVHTTDVSRTPPNDLGSGPEASSNRPRGSGDNAMRPNTTPIPSAERPSSEGTAPTPPLDPTTSTSPSHSAISPGSIDVLGTLLSVAAAATAASLLTGSSDPILTSGLAPPSSSSSEASSTTPSSVNSANTPSTPSSGASFNSPTLPYNPADTTYAASRAERMRQAWGTIRERLGLRPTPPPSQPSLGSEAQTNAAGAGRRGGAGLGQAASDQQITDTRELMLAEMARAFNIGLGLNGMAPTNQPSTNSNNGAAGEGEVGTGGQVLGLEGEVSGGNGLGEASERVGGTLPPEGSFDRFLVDLQADLRVALTGQEEEGQTSEETGVAGVSAAPATEPIGARASSEDPPTAQDPAAPETPVFASELPPAPSTSPPPLPPTLLAPSEESTPEVVGGETSATAPSSASIEATPSPGAVTEAPEANDVPDLASITSTDDDLRDTANLDVDENHGEDDDEEPVIVTSASTNATGSGSTERMDANGRINWWRLYRFPAINSSRSPPTASTTGSTENASATAASTSEATPAATHAPATSTPSNPHTSAPSAANPADVSTAPFLPNFLPPPSGQTVVPVIVVGLQSVNAGQFGFDHTHHGHGHGHNHAQPHHTHTHRLPHTHNHAHGTHDHGVRNPPARDNNHDATDGVARRAREMAAQTTTFQEELEIMEAIMQESQRERERRAAVSTDDDARRAERERARDMPVWDDEDEDEDDDAEDEYGGEEETIRARRGNAGEAGPSSSSAQPTRVEVVSDDEDIYEEEEEEDLGTDRPEMYLGLAGRRIDRNARARALALAEECEERRRRRDRRAAERAAERARMEAEVEAARARRAEQEAARARRSEMAAAAMRRAEASQTPATPAAAAAAAAEGTMGPGGTRTFLIYVIGGYYPPDHSIVTGGPESFESFEALLELAEMLGHAKPPTVTKEEIEKSGLETIKPAQLGEYEERGKIASSCTERCLICLDDYDPEDEIRVMSCRHAFHQGCVDKWMQTGRNNCPACRSTGVNTGSESAPAANSTTTTSPAARGSSAVPGVEALD